MKKLQKLCLPVGIGLLAVAAVVLTLWQVGMHRAAEKVSGYVQTIYAQIPQPQGAVPEERRDNKMPALAIDGTDFVGILEMPKFGSSLPVCGDWGAVSKYPCVFDGSVYDGSLQIGATTQKGQYDFYRAISVGDSVYFTDMEGNRFSYQVADIRYEKHADQDALQKNAGALTLFIKNVYAMEYIVVFCDLAH